MKAILGVLLGIGAVALAALAFIYSGLYDVAAVRPHTPVVRWALDTTMQRSVETRAGEIRAPSRFDEPQLQEGFNHFRESCVICHGAPGEAPADIGQGLRPDPPALSDFAVRWNRSELFWIVKHGIKMTGMPGFGATHDDDAIWSMVAFVEQLPNFSPEQYRQLEMGAEEEHEH